MRSIFGNPSNSYALLIEQAIYFDAIFVDVHCVLAAIMEIWRIVAAQLIANDKIVKYPGVYPMSWNAMDIVERLLCRNFLNGGDWPIIAKDDDFSIRRGASEGELALMALRLGWSCKKADVQERQNSGAKEPSDTARW